MEAKSLLQETWACFKPEAISSVNPAVWGKALPRAANLVLIIGTILLAASLPHSIAATDISIGICLLGWIARDLSIKKFHAARAGFELPILCFFCLDYCLRCPFS